MKLHFSVQKIGSSRKINLSDIGLNPDLDWIILVNACILILIPCIIYSVSLFNSVSEDRISVESVQVDNVSLNKKGMDDVLSRQVIKNQIYTDVVSGKNSKIPDPSL